MRKTYFSLEVGNSERHFSVLPSEAEIILGFCRSFVNNFNTDEYSYKMFVRDFFDSVSYFQIPDDNILDSIGNLKKTFHKAYNIAIQIERITKDVLTKDFSEDDAKALVSRYNKETLRHWVLSKLRMLQSCDCKRQPWEDASFLPIYDRLARIAESFDLFEEDSSTVRNFLLNLNTDGMPLMLHIRREMTSHVAIFFGMLKYYRLIHGRYQKIIQERECLIGAEGSPVTSSTLSSAKHLYWYRFEDGDDLVKNQDTPVDSLIVAFRGVMQEFNGKI